MNFLPNASVVFDWYLICFYLGFFKSLLSAVRWVKRPVQGFISPLILSQFDYCLRISYRGESEMHRCSRARFPVWKPILTEGCLVLTSDRAGSTLRPARSEELPPVCFKTLRRLRGMLVRKICSDSVIYKNCSYDFIRTYPPISASRCFEWRRIRVCFPLSCFMLFCIRVKMQV
jgi:hypothetical protein